MSESTVETKMAPITPPPPGPIVTMPERLSADLVIMRRDPAEFTVRSEAKCKFCYKRNSFDLLHPSSPAAGTWCPEHGWLHFDSVKIRPNGEEYVPKKKKALKIL